MLENFLWYRRRSLILTRPHDDHETNEEHELGHLSELITATKTDDPNGSDCLLYLLKMKIARFL